MSDPGPDIVADDNIDNLLESQPLPKFQSAELKRRSLCEKIYQFPNQVKKRLRALKRLQLSSINMECEFYNEVHALELKYHNEATQLYEKRLAIITGKYEPTDEESEWKFEEPSEIIGKMKKLKTAEELSLEGTEIFVPIGIPNFWLTVFKNASLLAESVEEHDEPVLQYLYDIDITYMKDDPMGFSLGFHFAPNEYFTNDVLTKKYFLKCNPDESDPFSFEGPEIVRAVGCKINWQRGKNVTQSLIQKKTKHRIRVASKMIPNDSFFNFFTPPAMPEVGEEIDEEIQLLINTDYDIGNYLRERIIPRAVLYYTGECLDDDDDEDDTSTLFDEDEEEHDDAGIEVDAANIENDHEIEDSGDGSHLS